MIPKHSNVITILVDGSGRTIESFDAASSAPDDLIARWQGANKREQERRQERDRKLRLKRIAKAIKKVRP